MKSKSTDFKDNLDLSEKKELYLPDTIYMVPNNNDYSIDTSEFCYARMLETPNFALFWAKEYGLNPMENTDTIKRFNVNELLLESERIYNYYVNDLKFVEKGNSITDKYKMLIFIYGGDGGTAFGGGEDNKVGIFWAPAIRMSRAPYGALAHEMGHSFQYLLEADKVKSDTVKAEEGGTCFSIYEMTSQYMLWQVYPEWMTFENYHLVDFMKQTHYAFMHEINMYHSPYVLEYWSYLHGLDFIGKLWRESNSNEDAVMTYKRITKIDQGTFNDEIFDAARRFVTWDMPRIEKFAGQYANQHLCKLNSVGEGWYRIDQSKCPQNYGYNGIQLKVPSSKHNVKLEFKGIAGTEGYRLIETEKAGWRYGFVSVKKDGSRVYSDTFSESDSEVSYTVPENTEFLWLVVSGAPTEHWIHKIDGDDNNDEQWPYQIRLTGTTFDDAIIL